MEASKTTSNLFEMLGYNEELENEIQAEQEAINELYEKLGSEGVKDLEGIYSQIASKQQSIRAKKQRLKNIGQSFYRPTYSIPNNLVIK